MYTTEQIKQFIQDKGIANDPHAIANYARQYGVTPGQVDQALGAAPGQSQQWLDLNTVPTYARMGSQSASDLQRSIGGGVSYSGNPHQAYQYAQARGWTPEQADQAFKFDPGTSGNWAQQQGLQWGANGSPTQAAPPAMPGAGGPPPSAQNPYMPNPGMSPYQPMAGGAPQQPQQPQQQNYQANPYINQMMGNITDAVNTNLQRNVLPSLRRGQVANGTLGSSRQGIAEGIAIGDTNKALSNAATNLYANQFNQDRQYGLQSDAMDLNVYNANQGWMRQGQQDQINLLNNMLGWTQQGINAGTQVQNTPLNYYQQFMNAGTQLGGMGSQSTQNLQGNPYLGAIGGAMTGYNLWNSWGK